MKNDVNFKDFAYLTLLRYKDIGVYNAIIEGKLITQGNAVNMPLRHLVGHDRRRHRRIRQTRKSGDRRGTEGETAVYDPE